MEFKKYGKVFRIDFDDKNNIIQVNKKPVKIEFASGWLVKFERRKMFSCDFQILKARIMDAANTGFMDSYYFKVFEKMQNL